MAFGSRFGTRYPSAGFGTKYPADSAGLPVEANLAALKAAIGSRLLIAGAVDDAGTITTAIAASNAEPARFLVDSVRCHAPGSPGPYAAPTTARRPYWHPTGGPNGGPCIELAVVSATNTGLERAFTSPPGHRVTFYAMALCNSSGVQSSFMMIRNPAGGSVAFRAQEKGTRDLSWDATSGLHTRAVYADGTLESLGPTSSPAPMRCKQWRLMSWINAATGNLMEVGGAGTTPQFAQSKALYSSVAQSVFNLGDTSASGTAAPHTKFAWWFAVQDATPADTAAVEAYAAAVAPDALIDSKASAILSGQSNADLAGRWIRSQENYISSDWHWAGEYGVGGTSLAQWQKTSVPSTNYDKLSALMTRCDATKPLMVGWWEGENAATSAPLSASWGADFAAMVADLDTDTGRTDAVFVIFRLAASFAATYTADVRAAQDAWVAANPTRGRIVNLDDLSRYDTSHYDPPSKIIALDRMKAFMPAFYP
jgi:hypothetical protein